MGGGVFVFVFCFLFGVWFFFRGGGGGYEETDSQERVGIKRVFMKTGSCTTSIISYTSEKGFFLESAMASYEILFLVC
jgi:hypothetical protein